MRAIPQSGYRLLPLIAVLALILLAALPGATSAAQPGLFDSVDTLVITLEGPFRDIARDKSEEPGYHEALLRVDGIELPLRIRARGKHRRQREVCPFPPLRLNFDKAAVKETVFAGQNKLKMVTHCRPSRSFQQHTLREFLAYRFFNLVSDYSFRVRLLEVTYVDTSDKNRSLIRTAFLIEDRKDMAKRNDAKVVRTESVPIRDLDPAATNLVELFQYMIGNTDWSSIRGPEGDNCCHNAQLLATQDGLYVPVPYDFDNTGLVNAPYASPSTSLAIDNVRQRLYRGFCHPDEVLAANIGRFETQRGAMLALIDEQPGLGKSTIKDMTRYLDRFFATIGDPAKRERQIERDCR